MAAFGIGFPFDISGSPKLGGDAGPAVSGSTLGPIHVGGLNAPAYPFAGVPTAGGGGGSVDRDLLLILGLGALIVIATRARK